ncbi:hypothetical protein [Scytonema sp. PRP1]|uniref:hypothetical protein n=1 Tax=Scytonema sp. PRP1 TaxID=3120513 RepID=UPI00300D0D1C
MMDYLNQEHPIFKASSDKRIFAVQTLLEVALQCSNAFRIQFDRDRLQRVIGIEEMMKIMPGLTERTAQTEPTRNTLDIYQETLNSENIERLQVLLSFEPEVWEDLPLNYIESITLLDEAEQIVLRGNEMNEFILFSLPEPNRSAVIEAFAYEGIPETVIEQVEVDPSRLYP